MKKKLLIITGIMVLFMSLGVFWVYTNYFMSDPEVQQQLNNQFGEEFFSSLEDAKVVNASEAVNNVEAKKVEKSVDSIIESVPEKVKEQDKGQATPTPVNETIVPEQITLDEINNKYKPKFNYLQSVALSRLDTRFSRY